MTCSDRSTSPQNPGRSDPPPQFSWDHIQWGVQTPPPHGPALPSGLMPQFRSSVLEQRYLASGSKGPNMVRVVMPVQKGVCEQQGMVSLDHCREKGGGKKVSEMTWVKALTFPRSVEMCYLIQIIIKKKKIRWGGNFGQNKQFNALNHMMMSLLFRMSLFIGRKHTGYFILQPSLGIALAVLWTKHRNI